MIGVFGEFGVFEDVGVFKDTGVFGRGGVFKESGGTPEEPIVITAPDGAYAGAPLTITGGKPIVAIIDGNVLVIEGATVAIYVFQFVINGTPFGDWFTERDTMIPWTTVEDDTIQVQDGYGTLSNALTALDALSGVAGLLDLRTHKGDKVPFGINPSADGLNPTWQGLIGDADQPSSGAQPQTKLESDGTPSLNFDGSNDWMSVGVWGGQVVYTVLVKSNVGPNWNDYWSFIDVTSGGNPVTDRWGLLTPAGSGFHNDPYPVEVRRNGSALTTPFSMAPINEWMVVTVKTAVSANNFERGIFQAQEVYFGNARAVAVFIHDGLPSNSDRDRVENYYLNSLKPV